ncbi:MAG: tryptophan--tRNA ligase, partial [Kangiellaceae bacterium]
TAGIGCLECKQPLVDCVTKEVAEFKQNAKDYEENPELVRNIIAEGSDRARDIAKETMQDVRDAMGLSYR